MAQSTDTRDVSLSVAELTDFIQHIKSGRVESRYDKLATLAKLERARADMLGRTPVLSYGNRLEIPDRD